MWANSSGVFMKKIEGEMGVRVSTLSQLKEIDINKAIEYLWK